MFHSYFLHKFLLFVFQVLLVQNTFPQTIDEIILAAQEISQPDNSGE